mmetsp:Transcript_39176/g.92199  ORF Transcript_39176/g.92199 Transcript_39176/m.92199 type:complete len:208 (-) Transcript_39176:36-659(-)
MVLFAPWRMLCQKHRKAVTPVKWQKDYVPKQYRSPILYGWHHNTPWAKHNNFSYFYSEFRPVRKTVVNHAQRVRQLRAFGSQLNGSPSVIQELSQKGPFTFFCPNDEAMEMIDEMEWEKLWDSEKSTFFRNHAVKGKWSIGDLAAAEGKPALLSLAQEPLPISVSGSLETMDRVVRIGGAVITKFNIRCWNGYVHVIDGPLIPQWRS